MSSDLSEIIWTAFFAVRLVGVFLIAAAMISAAIHFWTGSSQSKGILWSTLGTGIAIVIAPSLVGLIIDVLNGTK